MDSDKESPERGAQEKADDNRADGAVKPVKPVKPIGRIEPAGGKADLENIPKFLRRKEDAFLYQLQKEMYRSRTPDEALAVALGALKSWGYNYPRIYREENGICDLVKGLDLPEQARGICFPVSHPIFQHLFECENPYYHTKDIHSNPQLVQGTNDPSYYLPDPGLVAVKYQLHSETLGREINGAIVVNYNSKSPKSKALEDSSEIGVLELVGMAIAVNVARLLEYKHTLEEAKKDKLSGLYYKHIFHQDLNRLWEEAKKKKIYCAVIMEDFDFFKMINDTYGHPEGDKVIAGIGEYFKKKSKHSYRIGGDEFTQLLTFDGKVPVEQAEQKIVLFLKELRAELPQLYVPKGCRKLSASIGALLTRGGKYSNLGDIRTIHHKETGEARYDADSEGLYNRVDAAVYEAKDKGRDIIVFYGLKSKYLINGALAEK